MPSVSADPVIILSGENPVNGSTNQPFLIMPWTVNINFTGIEFPDYLLYNISCNNSEYSGITTLTMNGTASCMIWNGGWGLTPDTTYTVTVNVWDADLTVSLIEWFTFTTGICTLTPLRPITPYNQPGTVINLKMDIQDFGMGYTQTLIYVNYSADNITWNGWNWYGDTIYATGYSPLNYAFDAVTGPWGPGFGAGYYQFYGSASDSYGHGASPPIIPEAVVHLGYIPPPPSGGGIPDNVYASLILLTVFGTFLPMGYAVQRRSAGFYLMMSGFTFLALMLFLPSNIAVYTMMVIFAVYIIMIGVKKTFFSKI